MSVSVAVMSPVQAQVAPLILPGQIVYQAESLIMGLRTINLFEVHHNTGQ